MAEGIFGALPDTGFEYGMGAGWLPYYNQLQQLVTQQGAAQGGVGTSLLSVLTDLLTNPTGGPLGLAATARYGGPQGIAAGTKGKGIDTTKQSSIYDQLLQSLTGYVSNINKQPEDATFTPQLAGGGGVRVGGQPHYIVDAQGNPVAALTEDGKPEQVEGTGGVEVTPLDPMRKALYQARKDAQKEHSKALASAEASLKGPKLDPNKLPMMTPDSAAKAPSVMPGLIAGYQTGGEKLLDVFTPQRAPDITPTWGGSSQTRAQQVGQYYAPKEAGTFDELMAGMPQGGSYNERFAKLLGGALSSSNTAFNPESLKALNRGEAPTNLPSAQAMRTLSQSQAQSYTALLQAMGIIQSPGDLSYYINEFRPASMQ